MEHKIINNIQVAVLGDIGEDELSIYLTQLQAKQKYKIIKANVTVDGEHVDIKYVLEPVPFNRIRRITGYLVGNTDRWCDAKQAEEKDRIKHGQQDKTQQLGFDGVFLFTVMLLIK